MPLPAINAVVEGWAVDAYWPDHGLVVELDGYHNHRSRAQIERDRRKELDLRTAGLRVNRYADRQVAEDGTAVIDDVIRGLNSR